jgi:prepilin-type N-terminal cleavage/methylation domain-containing protein/prepilin-type processing-associated H-X9-DG protein
MNRRGLTLIELLVVIVVIALLMGILLPAVVSIRGGGRRSQCINNLKSLASAVSQFHERHGTLPVYWGFMNGAGDELFGPWLLHLLPDLNEQLLYDEFEPTMRGDSVEIGHWQRGPEIAPQIPASPDYQPGTWVSSTTSVINHVGIQIPVVRSELVGRVGTPARGPWHEWRWVVTGQSTTILGLHPTFPQAQANKSLDVLHCSDDGQSALMGEITRQGQRFRAPLTNYMANAHVFMKFENSGGSHPAGRVFSPSHLGPNHDGMGGRFRRANSTHRRPPPHHNQFWPFHHHNSGTSSLSPRQFAHVIDGLSNTIMFGEGMRQCDNGLAFRYAFLPTSERGKEHAFGIDLSVTEVGDGTPAFNTAMAYGNTIMFQQRPTQSTCNKFRLQGNHDGVMNVAMCDGSVRSLSPRISRREQCDPDVAGREFGRNTYTPEGLGGVGTGGGSIQRNFIGDGIWDMLMVPNDPPENVLSNTGEVGKEK